MREDMAKVIVERPRNGGHGRERKLYKNLEDAPLMEGVKQRYTSKKQLNENLSPLYRWLNSQVGRNWNKVHSELRERIDVRSAVQQHIWQHAQQYVKKGVMYVGNVPHAIARFSSHFTPLHAGELFICPKTGILKRNGQKVARRRYTKPGPDPETFKRVKTNLAFTKVDGVWYQLTLTKLPTEIKKQVVPLSTYTQYYVEASHDIFLGKTLSLTIRRHWRTADFLADSDDAQKAYGDGRVYCSKKKQLSTRELLKAGLK